MIGFFEHQYLSYKKSHLTNLIALAKSDGEIHEHERKLIFKVGAKYGLKEKQIEKLIESESTDQPHVPKLMEKKMEQLYDLTRMVYADGVVDDSEVKFCKEMMKLFELKEEIVDWMIDIFDQEERPLGKKWDELVKEAEDRFSIK